MKKAATGRKPSFAYKYYKMIDSGLPAMSSFHLLIKFPQPVRIFRQQRFAEIQRIAFVRQQVVPVHFPVREQLRRAAQDIRGKDDLLPLFQDRDTASSV